jgi:4-hydroxy-2-oxoheptanedioate aldolase
MREYRLKRRLEVGETVYGTFVSLPEPGLVEIVGAAGYDFVIIDLEHTPVGFGRMRDMLMAADSAGLVPLVRVGNCEANPILRVLDAGAAGVAAPHICTAQDAQALVNACRYPPVGIRGVSGASRAANYGQMSFADHVTQSNQEILTIALIEDREGVENIDAITSIPGLDVVFPGPGDLSASLGLIGQMEHPSVSRAVNRIAEAVHAQEDKILGYQIMRPAQMDRCRELAATMIIFSQDSRVCFGAYRDHLQEIKSFE